MKETEKVTRAEFPVEQETVPGDGREDVAQGFHLVIGAVQGMRLTIDEKAVVKLEDVLGSLQEARRMFEKGDWNKALELFDRASSAFEQKVGQWEGQVQRRSAEITREVTKGKARTKEGYSIQAKWKLETERGAVRSRIGAARIPIRRLRTALEKVVRSAKGDEG